VLSGHFGGDLDPALVDSYLDRRDLVVRWCDVRQSLVFPAGGPGFVFRPDHFPVEPRLSVLFIEPAEPIHEERLDDGTFVFSVFSLSARRLERVVGELEANQVGWSDATVFPDGLPQRWQIVELPAVFDERIALVGYGVLNGARVSAGAQMDLLTIWRVIQPGPLAARMFVHVLRPDGTVVAGVDSFGAPANRWIERDIVVQLHRLSLPADLPASQYPIELGWYLADSGTRWRASVDQGVTVDRLLLSPLIVSAQGDD
jgi:hypothetical protein